MNTGRVHIDSTVQSLSSDIKELIAADKIQFTTDEHQNRPRLYSEFLNFDKEKKESDKNE